jgi:hypothetical protein
MHWLCVESMGRDDAYAGNAAPVTPDAVGLSKLLKYT